MYKKHLLSIAILVILTMLFAACGTVATPAEAPATEVTAPTQEVVAAPEIVTVRFGNLPYLDYAPWGLAEKLGYLEEEGIKLETTMFEVEQPMAEALISKSIDVGAGSDGPFITLAAKAPELRMVSFQAIFTGYAIMGRPGEVKTYDDFVAEGKTREEALAEAAKQLDGKTIILPGGASFMPVLDTALGYAGLDRSAVEIIDMDPVEGAAAFIQGTGDFYSDGLPQRFRLEQEGMVSVLTGNQLAGGAMVFAGVYTTQEYLDANPAVIKGMLRAWFRTIDYLTNNEDDALNTMVAWINEQSGSGMKVEDAKRFIKDLLIFPTYDEVGNDYFYSESSPFFWKKRFEYLVNYVSTSEGVDTSAIDLDTMVPAPTLYLDVAPSQ